MKREEFRRLTEAGAFFEYERLELVDGEIMEMSPIGHRHATCVRKLIARLLDVGKRALIEAQNPLGVSEGNEFYPDLVLLRRKDDFYAGRIPTASDTILVIEVADTTLLSTDPSRNPDTLPRELPSSGSSTSRVRASGSTASPSKATTERSSKPGPARF